MTTQTDKKQFPFQAWWDDPTGATHAVEIIGENDKGEYLVRHGKDVFLADKEDIIE